MAVQDRRLPDSTADLSRPERKRVRLSEYSTSGFVKDGELIIRNRRGWRRALSGFRRCEVVVTLECRHAHRSQAQNRYLWGVVYALLSEHTGYTADELHAWAKAKFLPKALAFANGNGEVIDELVIGGSTAKLNKLQFGDFIEHVRRFAAEHLGVVIPDPING